MTASSLDLRKRTDLGWLADVLRDVQSAAPATRWLLVGAMARDVWLAYAHGIDTGRATTDVDLALAVEHWDAFHTLRTALIASSSFVATRVEHRLQHRSGRKVDLVPFGNIADDEGLIAWPPDGSTRMNVLGYDEALASSVPIFLPSDVELRVVSLPGLILLKICAWAERHLLQPRKDAHDLWVVLRNYLDAGPRDRLYEEHPEWLDRADFDYDTASAELAGMDVRALLLEFSPDAQGMIDMLSNILSPQVDADGEGRLVGEIPLLHADAFRGQLIAFLRGLSGG